MCEFTFIRVICINSVIILMNFIASSAALGLEQDKNVFDVSYGRCAGDCCTAPSSTGVSGCDLNSIDINNGYTL